MLKQRLTTSAVLITIVSVLIYLDAKHPLAGVPGIWLLPLLGFFAIGTAADVVSLLKTGGRLVHRHAAITATAIVTLSACVPLLWPLAGQTYPATCPIGKLGWILVGSLIAIFYILIGEMSQYGKPNADREAQAEEQSSPTLERILSAVFVSQYVGLPMALLVSLRTMGTGNWGLAALLTMIAVTKSADAGAYFTGRTLGKHKLIPRLSPGKTREGAVGGIAIATIVAFVCLSQLFPFLTGGAQLSTTPVPIKILANDVWGAILLGPLLAVAGMVGDLAESMIKRDSGAKDSGKLLPGLGGVWDVTDSLIAAVLPALLCFTAGVGG